MAIKIENNTFSDVCPLCNSKEIKYLGTINYPEDISFSSTKIVLLTKPELWKCNHCFSCFTQNIIQEKQAYELYINSSSVQRWSTKETFNTSKSKNIIEYLKSMFSKKLKVLDIGCNTGLLLDFAKSHECITSGIELSVESKHILKKKGHQVFESIDEIEDESLDVITAFDLIEHLYDVKGFLETVYTKLKKNGRLIILTGNIDSLSSRIAKSNWWYIKYPEHIVFPSKKYFIENTNFILESSIETYASRGYENSYYKIFYSVLKATLRSNYNGLPSIGPDHHLLVLKK
ncbi:MAG TPA: class I SAM-dependent methyltransferase [Aliarcobacter sp.]|nr:class I SAM-dependent methyltransferase [Aliarcobacter sp.]